jgi:ATP-dependent helicase/nuclease subunit A
VSSEFERATPAVGRAVSSPMPRAPQVLRRLPFDWTPPPAPEPIRARALEMLEVEDPEPPFDWVTLTSRHIGTLVHREIERMCRTGTLDKRPARESLMTRFRIELEELGVPANRSEEAAARVYAALTSALEDARGRWVLGLEGGLKESESELALSSVIDGQIVTGVIDRTFVDQEGVRWIVDFKTSTHEGGGLDAFLAEEVKRYRPQLSRYAALMRAYKPRERVKAALYFPLLKAWREVDV